MVRHLAGTAVVVSMLALPFPDARAADAGSPGTSSAPTAAGGFKGLVAALSGSWILAIRSEPPQQGASSTRSTGTARWYTAADSRVLLEDEHLPVSSMDVKLLGLIWWDEKSQTFSGLLCTNRSSRTCDPKASLDDIRIHWDGRRLLIEELEHQRDGSVLLFRESYSEITPKSYVQLGEIGPPAGPFRRLFTVQATRSGD